MFGLRHAGPDRQADLQLCDYRDSQGQFSIHFPKRFTNPMRLARLLPYRMYFWLIRKVTG